MRSGGRYAHELADALPKAAHRLLTEFPNHPIVHKISGLIGKKADRLKTSLATKT